jgi:hypothetical protein
MNGRLAVLPEQATALERAQLLAALSLGTEIIGLREVAVQLKPEIDGEPALAAVAASDTKLATARLAELDAALASVPAGGPALQTILPVRAGILVMSEALNRHRAYFDAGALP